jgi:CheY-like chemotaxis protein
VLACAEPEEALEVVAASHDPIDLVLTDVVMPQMDGPGVVRRIRSDRPGIQVLYMSGYSDEALGGRGILEPGTHLIAKPFAAADLLLRVRELLAKA